MAGNVFARGKSALAICPRCSLQVPYWQLKKDGQNKNFVCRDCWDPKHPQEIIPTDIYDPTSLRHPRTERAKNNDSFLLDANSLAATGAVGLFTVT